jgi:hypothetical protein
MITDFLLQNKQKMYEQLNSSMGPSLASPSSAPEHISIAMGFANEIIERFQPHETNEILKEIRDQLSKHRIDEIEKAEAKLTYLKDSLSNL